MKRRARRCLGVDIGSTSLKVAELSQDRSGVIIQRLLQAPVEVTPDTPANVRWDAVVQALRDLLRQHKIGTRQAVFALPGHAVFVRRVRLPRTSEERLERIIRFEARQQIPFPLEQTVLQYQVASTDIEDEVEVLLVAIKREIVEHYMSLVRRLGLRPIRLGVSAFALFNFHMYDQGIEPEEFALEGIPSPEAPESEEEEEEEAEAPEGEKPKKKAGLTESLKGILKRKPKPPSPEKQEVAEAPAEPDLAPLGEIEEVRAFVNIGANTMDLAIGRTGGSRIIGFSRSIPLAGNQLTRAIQDRCGCDSFAEAERLKREQTAVVVGDAPPPADRYSEQACRAIMPTVDRMVAEIRRSLDFYISQPDGMAVDRLVVSGGQAALANLPAYLEDRLGIPVELATEIHNPACRSNVRADMEITDYLICIGLALQGLGEACVTIDFLPEHLKGWIEFKRKNVQLVVQLALVGAMLFVASQVGVRMAGSYRDQANYMRERIVLWKPLQERYQEAQTKRMTMMMMVYVLKRASAQTQDYGVDRDYTFKVLALLREIRPPDVFYGDVRLGSNGELEITALAERRRSAPELTEALNSLEEIEKASLVTPATETRLPHVGNAYRFEISAQVKGKVSKIEPQPTPEAASPYEGWRQRVPGPAPAPMEGADQES